MKTARRPGPLGSSRAGDEAFRILLQALEEIRPRRTDVPIEVHDMARDRAVDALLRRPGLVRLPDGRVSRGRVRSLARRQFVWALKGWQRRCLTPDGGIRPGPRTALSLDSRTSSADGQQGRPLSELLGSDATEPGRVLSGRETLRDIASEAAAAGPTTWRVVAGYMRGETVKEIAHATGLNCNAVEARKSRLAKKVERLRESTNC